MTPSLPARRRASAPQSAACFVSAQQGLAAVEFAFAAPVLLLVLLGFVELDRYAWTTRQLENAANSITQMLTQTPTDKIERADLDFAYDSLMVLFPRVLEDSALRGHNWRNDISVSMSSVALAKSDPACVSNCAYSAKVAWSGGAGRRPCATPLTAVANDRRPSPTTLPRDAFGPNALVVVDLAYDYAPRFASKLFGSFRITRSSYMQPRYVAPSSYLKYAVAGGDAFVTTCPGF